MLPNSPIVNAGIYYVNGLNLSPGVNSTTNKLVSVSAGLARDSTNVFDIVNPAALSINGAKVGANGVDVAVLADSSMYAVYIIGDSTEYQPTAGLLSLTFGEPSLPFGYDCYRRIGAVLTSSGGYVLTFWQYGVEEKRVMYYDVGIAITTANVTSFTAVSLAAAVPPINTRVLLDLTYTPNSAGNVAQFLPYGSIATAGIVRFGYGVAAAQVGDVLVPIALNAGVPEMLYKLATSDSLTTLVNGYEDNL